MKEFQQELKDAIGKCESIERKLSDRDSELAEALQSMNATRVKAHGACWEIQEAKHIAASKAFNTQSKFVRRRYILLTCVWSSLGAFVDLPRSIVDDAEFFQAEEGSSTEKLLWSSTLHQSIRCPLAIS